MHHRSADTNQNTATHSQTQLDCITGRYQTCIVPVEFLVCMLAQLICSFGVQRHMYSPSGFATEGAVSKFPTDSRSWIKDLYSQTTINGL